MSRFRKVDAGMWGDRRFRDLTDNGKLLWCFLLTGPQVTSLPGVIVAGKSTLADGLGWSVRKLTNALAELERTDERNPVPMIKTDWKAPIVFLTNGPRRNVPANPSVVRGWADHWRCTPECALKLEIELQIRSVLTSLPPSEKTGRNDILREFDEITGARASMANRPSPSDPTTPCPPPSSTPCPPLCPPPTPPPSLAHARAATAPVTSPALSQGVQGGTSARLVELGTARCVEACEVYLSALAELGWNRGPVRERWELQAICDAVNTHLRGDGTIRSALDELRRAVAAWSEALEETPQYAGGWSARKFNEWLSTRRRLPQSGPRMLAHPDAASADAEALPAPITDAQRAADAAFLAELSGSTLVSSRDDIREAIKPIRIAADNVTEPERRPA